jgi:hypothetical protein
MALLTSLPTSTADVAPMEVVSEAVRLERTLIGLTETGGAKYEDCEGTPTGLVFYFPLFPVVLIFLIRVWVVDGQLRYCILR